MAMTFLQAALTLLLVVFLVPKLGIPGAPLSELIALCNRDSFPGVGHPRRHSSPAAASLTRLLLPLVLALGAGSLMAGTEMSMLLRGLLTAGVTTAVYLLGNWVTGPLWLRNFVREEIALVLETLGRFVKSRR